LAHEILRKCYITSLQIWRSPVSCSHCILRDPKSHFSTILFTHDSHYSGYVTDRAFRCSAPAVRNSLTADIVTLVLSQLLSVN